VKFVTLIILISSTLFSQFNGLAKEKSVLIQTAELNNNKQAPSESLKYPEKMVFIPAGDFLSGLSNKLKKMFIDSFSIDKYEATQANFQKCNG
jgi:formylglycine-generating enzyme required for sulfatase activity